MLTISKPLSAGQARAYHHEEFSNAQENYYSEGDRIRGEWQGKLAEKSGLHGEVREDHFHRLSEGQHPIESACRLRICSNEPQQPGTNCRPRARSH